MPFIEVSLIEGRKPEQLRDLIHEVTDAVVKSLDVAPGSVHVALRELPATHWATGDVTIDEKRSAAQ